MGYRIAAYVLDASLLFSLMVGVVWIATGGDSTSDAEETILGFGLIAVWLVYVAVTMSLLKGQTLGKALGGIRVIKASGAPAGAGIGVLREVFRGLVLTGFLGIYEAGYSPLWLLIVPAYALWPLFDSRNQALHDRFAGGTRVVKARRRPRRAWIVFPVACAALAAWFALTELASL